MYLLEIDRTQNRIHITLSDRFDELQAKSLLDEIQLRFEELEQDFHVLCDLTTLEEFDRSARSYFRAVMDSCNKAGVRRIIRIIPSPLNNWGLTIMSHIHYDSDISVINCKTLQEASKHLN